jgi:hypothetical protein
MSDDRSYNGEAPADDVLQDQTPDAMLTVPVKHEGPIESIEVPAIGGGMTTVVLDTAGANILKADPKRKLAVIMALEQDLYLGQDSANVNAGGLTVPNGMEWPKNVPLVISHRDEVWASSKTSTTKVSISIERWAR